MNKVDDEVIINDICDYAKKHKVKELLQDLRRIIVDQPEDPVPTSLICYYKSQTISLIFNIIIFTACFPY